MGDNTLMAINNFKPFALDPNANVTSQADWEALPALLSGFTAGKASSAQVNKAIRQASFIAAALAQYTANKSGLDVLDDGDLNGFISKMGTAFGKDFQALDATLTALAGLATGENKLPYFTGNDTAAQTDLTSVGRDIIGKNTIADILTYLGLGASAFGVQNRVVISATGVTQWSVPDVLKKGRKCKVKVIGAGGSGGIGNAVTAAGQSAIAGGGGGAGGISESLLDLTGIDSVTVTVGVGGTPVTSLSTNGVSGGTSSFGSYLSATGGIGGGQPSGGESGIGIGGDTNSSGGPGSPGGVLNADNNGVSSMSGGSGGGPGGNGAAQVSAANKAADAKAHGGGGAGLKPSSGSGITSGRGGDGLVIIEW
ncbi:hypothetical protein AWD67_002072 [Escherichia coli]